MRGGCVGPDQVPPIQYASARGEVEEIRLPDGSSMTLDADSQAVGRFGGNIRTVELSRGRAYFAVMPDRQRPVIVDMADRRVVAIGTRFDVGLAAGTLTVTLMEGAVTVGPRDGSAKPVALKPGQQFVETGGKARVRTMDVAEVEAPGWRSGLITFDDRPLAEAVDIMNRYSQDRVIVRNADVSAMRISGQFKAGDARRFARTVADVHDLRAVSRPDGIELVPSS